MGPFQSGIILSHNYALGVRNQDYGKYLGFFWQSDWLKSYLQEVVGRFSDEVS